MSRARPPARPPILRVVEGNLDSPGDDDTRDAVPDGYAATAIQKVVENIRRDAEQLADGLMVWVSTGCQGFGNELRPEQSARLRQSAYDMVAGFFCKRLMMGLGSADRREAGLTDTDADVSNETDVVDDVLPETDTSLGLMERFRAALAEDGESS